MILKRKHIENLYNITLNNERWSTIPDYDGYLVSDQGRVWSVSKGDLMTQEEHEHGYLRVLLRSKDGNTKKIRVHRLVAETFLPNPLGKTQVDHKNGSKIDNRLVNLRWLSNAENQIAAVQKGSHKTKTNQSAQYRLKNRQEKFREKREQELKEIRERTSRSKED